MVFTYEGINLLKILLEMFRKILDEGEAGDNAGLLLRGIDKDEIRIRVKNPNITIGLILFRILTNIRLGGE